MKRPIKSAIKIKSKVLDWLYFILCTSWTWPIAIGCCLVAFLWGLDIFCFSQNVVSLLIPSMLFITPKTIEFASYKIARRNFVSQQKTVEIILWIENGIAKIVSPKNFQIGEFVTFINEKEKTYGVVKEVEESIAYIEILGDSRRIDPKNTKIIIKQGMHFQGSSIGEFIVNCVLDKEILFKQKVFDVVESKKKDST